MKVDWSEISGGEGVRGENKLIKVDFQTEQSLSKHEIAAEKIFIFKQRGNWEEVEVRKQKSLRKDEVGPSGSLCKRSHT